MTERITSIVRTTGAPAAIGPYSQAVISDGTVWCSGQVALDPSTGALVPGGVSEQTVQVLANLSAVLAAAGCAPRDVVRCTVFLRSMDDFAAMNAEYSKVFTQDPPARATVEVSRLPKDALVEIDCVAVVGHARRLAAR
ncbi:MAG: 2-iminobutanoate/2-iminopropanoate deaminase [Planctomycetota bacterium]|jgi:2-iminobutanoate/2-iminopropanoate deaminase